MKKIRMPNVGERVTHSGKPYQVSHVYRCHDEERFFKPELRAHRVMENGQVLINSSVTLNNKWRFDD